MVLRIHTSPVIGKVHVTTSWYLVTDEYKDAYLTNSIYSLELSTTNLTHWSIDTSSLTDDIYAIAIANYDDGSSQKQGPVPVKNNSTNQIVTSISGAGVETPSLKLISNTYTGLVGDIVIESSRIRPSTNVLREITWYITDLYTGNILFSEKSDSDLTLTLDNTKLDLDNLVDISVDCVHMGTNNVVSKCGNLVVSINDDAISMVTSTFDPDIENTIVLDTALANLIIDEVKIYNHDRVIVYSSTDSVIIPRGALDYNIPYIVELSLSDSDKHYRRVYNISTSNPDVRQDVTRTDIALLDSVQYPDIAYGSMTEVQARNILVSTKPYAETGNTISKIYNYDTKTLTPFLFILHNDVLNDSITSIYNFSDTRIFASIYDINSKALVFYSMETKYLDNIGFIPNYTLIPNSSSNVAILSAREVYAISDHKIIKSDGVSRTIVSVLPPDTFNPVSDADYRIELINDNELYVITNTDSILLFNIYTHALDKLNTFARDNDSLNSSVTSDGGLLIVDNDGTGTGGYTHLYNRTNDTIVTEQVYVKGLIVENNGKVLKVTDE